MIATASDGFKIQAFVVDATTAFFATSKDLQAVPKAGGFPTTLASGTDADSFGEIAADDSHVYLLRDFGNGTSNLVRVATSGGGFETFAATENHFALDQQNAYWVGPYSTSLALYRQPKVGGSTSIIIENFDSPGWDTRLVVHDSFLYWLSGGGTLNRVDKNATGGSVTSVPLLGGITNDLAVDSDGAFFSTGNSIGHLALSGGSASEVVTGLLSPNHVAISGSKVYWEGATGVFSAPKTGGPPTQHYSTAGGGVFGRIVVDNTHVYFAEGSSLYRAPK